MENNDRPVDFERLRMIIRETAPCRSEKAIEGSELIQTVEEKLKEKRFQDLLPTGKVFLQEIRDYFKLLATKQFDLIRESGTNDRSDARLWHSCRVTQTQLEMMLQSALKRCLLAYVEPGEAIGAIGAQSIGEPGTQMTLKVSQRAVVSLWLMTVKMDSSFRLSVCL